MCEIVTEYKFENVTVRIHGEQPDRTKLEAACIDFMKKVIEAESKG